MKKFILDLNKKQVVLVLLVISVPSAIVLHWMTYGKWIPAKESITPETVVVAFLLHILVLITIIVFDTIEHPDKVVLNVFRYSFFIILFSGIIQRYSESNFFVIISFTFILIVYYYWLLSRAILRLRAAKEKVSKELNPDKVINLMSKEKTSSDMYFCLMAQLLDIYATSSSEIKKSIRKRVELEDHIACGELIKLNNK